MIPVVISGGSGTRLWPFSRGNLPKQFCEIFDSSLHLKTLKRLQPFGAPWVITSEAFKNLTLNDLSTLGIPAEQAIFEPMSRNTAPAVATVCSIFQQAGKGHEVVGIFPADHLILDEAAFSAAVKAASQVAAKGKVVTLGIKPEAPSTAYGYIQLDNKISQGGALPVRSFVEKPNAEKANKYYCNGDFVWNAGIFIFRVEVMIEFFKKFQPTIWDIASCLKQGEDWSETFSQFQNISIDYAIMERLSSNHLMCVTCDPKWSDVGVYAFCGLDDVILVDTEDATLVVKRGFGQEVKNLVEQIPQDRVHRQSSPLVENRPWGRFEVTNDSKMFKSKIHRLDARKQIS